MVFAYLVGIGNYYISVDKVRILYNKHRRNKMSNDKYEVEVYLFTQEEPVKYITGWVDIDVNELNGLTTQGDFIKLGDNYIRKADIKQILSHKIEKVEPLPMPPMANSDNEVAPF